ncbi:MAG: hypothetical protein RLZZ214_3799 [Verrucomicrobiota bacterium]|jgi:hypothetical protein
MGVSFQPAKSGQAMDPLAIIVAAGGSLRFLFPVFHPLDIVCVTVLINIPIASRTS